MKEYAPGFVRIQFWQLTNPEIDWRYAIEITLYAVQCGTQTDREPVHTMIGRAEFNSYLLALNFVNNLIRAGFTANYVYGENYALLDLLATREYVGRKYELPPSALNRGVYAA